MKRIFYISILIVGFTLLLSVDSNTPDFDLIGKTWVKKLFSSDEFVSRKNFRYERSGYKFLDKTNVEVYCNIGWCGNCPLYAKMEGKWKKLNDSLIEINYRFEEYNWSFKEKIKIEWVAKKKIKLENISFSRKYEKLYPKPFLID